MNVLSVITYFQNLFFGIPDYIPFSSKSQNLLSSAVSLIYLPSHFPQNKYLIRYQINNMHWEYSNIAKMSSKDFELLFNNLNTVFADRLSKDKWKDRRSLLLNE